MSLLRPSYIHMQSSNEKISSFFQEDIDVIIRHHETSLYFCVDTSIANHFFRHRMYSMYVV